MTNTRALKEYIDKRGLKLSYVAKTVGLSRQQLSKKINNMATFNQFEIEKLCELLNIDALEEKERIFFAKEVN